MALLSLVIELYGKLETSSSVLSARLMNILAIAESPPRCYTWKGGRIGWVPLAIVSTLKNVETSAWALVDTGRSADLVIDKEQFHKLRTSARGLHTIRGVHLSSVPAFITDGTLLAPQASYSP